MTYQFTVVGFPFNKKKVLMTATKLIKYATRNDGTFSRAKKFGQAGVSAIIIASQPAASQTKQNIY